MAAIADAIRRYLDTHPEAADSAEGIAAWWLEGSAVRTDLVQAALDTLVREGVMQHDRLLDGTIIYSAALGGGRRNGRRKLASPA
jgi:hypothetical protein